MPTTGGRWASRRRRDEAGRADGNAGAWAAAAVVLALGALGFGIASQVRLSDVESRLNRIEAGDARTPASSTTVEANDRTTTTLERNGADPAAPVGRQPLDPETAREAVIHAYETVYDGSAPADNRLAFIDDPTGVSGAFTAAAAGTLATVAPNLQARVDDVTFTSAREASVRYSILANDVPQFADRVGTASLKDGVWVVTRATVCADLAEAAAPCD